MSKVRRATAEEVRNYVGLYPLSHYATLEGHQVAVEYLGKHWDKEDPQYEAIAPDGYHFEPDVLHTMLGMNMADLRDRLASSTLQPCTAECE